MKWLFLFITLSLGCNSQVTNQSVEKDRLTLLSKISLPGVRGRIDHIAYDSIDHRVFIAALGNNTVEVVNINTKQIIQTIKGINEPQGIVYIPSLKKIVVACGDNGDCIFFDALTYKRSGTVHLKNDADNIRYDETNHLIYVGYGNGAIAIIDPNQMKQIGNIQLDGHPESFQLSKKQNRLFVNVPDANEIEVADLTTNSIITKWKNKNISSNFPMALDEDNGYLFVSYRNPARLRMMDATAGTDIFITNCAGDADDVFINTDSLVIVSAGKGFIDVFKTDRKQLNQINHIKTSIGARTSLLLSNEKKFLLAVPAYADEDAALWVYSVH